MTPKLLYVEGTEVSAVHYRMQHRKQRRYTASLKKAGLLHFSAARFNCSSVKQVPRLDSTASIAKYFLGEPDFNFLGHEYFIEKARLPQTRDWNGEAVYSWPLHMSEKREWVSTPSFTEAFAAALDVHFGHHDTGMMERTKAAIRQSRS